MRLRDIIDKDTISIDLREVYEAYKHRIKFNRETFKQS